MSAAKGAWGRKHRRINAEGGTAAVEFSLLVIVFLTLVFAIMELARAMYVINTLEEVTRRAATGAAAVSVQDSTALANIRANAVFRTDAGRLFLADPVTDQNVVIDYLAVTKQSDGTYTSSHIPSGSLPACPAKQRMTCLTNRHDPQCVQLVRARICASSDDSGACTQLRYQMLTGFLDLPMNVPMSTTIVPAGSLGYTIGATPCP